jgi:hypothetical protein
LPWNPGKREEKVERGEKIEEKDESRERDMEGKRKTITFLLFCCPVVLILHYFLWSNTYSLFLIQSPCHAEPG